MKHIVVLLLMLIWVGGCKGISKNRSGEYNPASSPVGAVTSPVPSSDAEVTSIIGRCELSVEGDSVTKPCSDVRLVIRSDRNKKSAEAVVDGFNFKFSGLEQERSYRLSATSELYDVTTDTAEISPGETVNIKVRAKLKR